jgi:hypothetical protein
VSDFELLDPFPTFEEWSQMKGMVDAIPPLPKQEEEIVKVAATLGSTVKVRPPAPQESHYWIPAIPDPPPVQRVLDWQRVLYEKHKEQAEVQQKFQDPKFLKQMHERRSGEAKNGEDFWKQIFGG